MSGLEIISIASEVATVVGLIYGKYQQVQRCKVQCRILAEKIIHIHKPLENFYATIKDSRDKEKELKEPLRRFLIVIRDAQDIVAKHTNIGFFGKVFLSNRFEDEFKSINQRLGSIKESFSVIMSMKISGGLSEIAVGVGNLDTAVKEASEDVKNAVKKAKDDVITAIQDVQKAKEGKVLKIPIMKESEIMLDEHPGSLGRASGTLNKFQNIELIYNKEIVENKHKLEIMWKLSSCEGILTLYGLYKYKDMLYMITERINQEYPTLDLMIKRRVFFRNWGIIRSMSLELANAIGFMHVCEILHKAICSSNICIVGDRHVRIHGFEYARHISAGTDNLMGAREQLRWTAPERLKVPKPDYDEKCDIYSLGVVMWSLATHEAPFEAIAPRKILTTPLDIPKDVPREFAAIIEGCIDRDREKRWEIEKIIDELSKLIPENLEGDS